jgi:allantoate deiminase
MPAPCFRRGTGGIVMQELNDAPLALGARIDARIDELNKISDDPANLTRLYLTPSHRAAVDRVTQWMRDTGLSVTFDAAGTLIGRYAGATPDAPVLLLGSHLDSVRNAGRFDGPLGVLAALAVVEELQRTGTRLPFAIDVVAFGDEEGVRFPSTLGGSRALAGLFDPKTLDERDGDGISRRDALTAFGCDPSQIGTLARDPARTLGYVEVHIEQGPVLEAGNLPVGIVTAISGATRGTIELEGVSGHAGTVPMGLRHDALAAAAEIVLAAETLAKTTPDLVATVGRLEVPGGAVNVVAGHARLSIDIRSASDAIRYQAVETFRQRVAEICTARGVTADVAMTYDAPAAPCDPKLSRALAASVERAGLEARHLPSGAGHDGMSFRGKIPIAMLFVRCKGGISHNPAEFASIADIDTAARVLHDFVLSFSA